MDRITVPISWELTYKGPDYDRLHSVIQTMLASHLCKRPQVYYPEPTTPPVVKFEFGRLYIVWAVECNIVSVTDMRIAPPRARGVGCDELIKTMETYLQESQQ